MRKYLILLIFSLSSIFAQNWTIEPIDSGPVYIRDCSIAIDNQNYPHIAYCHRRSLGGNFVLEWVKYARWNGIAWEFQPVETTVISDGMVAFKTIKLCIDNQNRPHIAYAKDSVQFKYAYYDGNSWQISMIDSFNVRSNEVLRWCIDMTLSETGVPHISYFFINFNDSTRGIRHAFKSGDSWIIQTVWQENRIPTSYLSTSAIDLNNFGYPVITFEILYPSSIDTGFLYCASFNGQTWKVDTVEIRTSSYVWYQVFSLKINSPDRIHIFYKYIFWLFHAVTRGDSWTIELIDANGTSSAAGDMILDGDKPNVVYSSTMDPLTYAYKIDTLWNYEVIDSGELRLFPSITQDNENRLHVSYIIEDPSFFLLRYARRESPFIAEKGSRSIAESKTLIEIYPNPVKDVLRVRGSLSKKTIKIFDVSGKMVKEVDKVTSSQEHKEEMKISLKGINQGVYFLELGKETKKFLVIR